MSLDVSIEQTRGGYALLAAELRQLGLMKRRTRYYVLLTGSTFAALATMVSVLYLLRHSWWVLLMAPVAAIVSTQIAFLGHDNAHHTHPNDLESDPDVAVGAFVFDPDQAAQRTGLDLQIEHHLFPSMPRPNLRRAQPVVRHFCKERGVSYAESTAFGAYALALRHLNEVGHEVHRPPSASRDPRS